MTKRQDEASKKSGQPGTQANEPKKYSVEYYRQNPQAVNERLKQLIEHEEPCGEFDPARFPQTDRGKLEASDELIEKLRKDLFSGEGTQANRRNPFVPNMVTDQKRYNRYTQKTAEIFSKNSGQVTKANRSSRETAVGIEKQIAARAVAGFGSNGPDDKTPNNNNQ